jgi:hypothetical protein
MEMYVYKNFVGPYGHCTLVEMTAAEFRAAVATAPEHVFYERCSAERARAWVKAGGHHGTRLYIDTYRNRVVYGRDR